MKFLVVGGAGFIGSHLCDALLHTENKVVCIDNLSMGSTINITHLLGEKKFIFYKADAADREQIDPVMEKERPDFVFHLAANSDIRASADSPSVEYQNTYTTTFCILDAMRRHDIKKIFFASTSAVYGDKRNTILDECTPRLEPVSYYGAAKLGSEALIHAFTYMNDMQSLIFRFPNVVGPRLTHGVIFDFISKLKTNPGELEILGDGSQTKPYIYVTDLIDAILMFMEKLNKGVMLYNIGVEGETSVTEIAKIVCEEMGLKDTLFHYTGGEGGWKGDVPKFAYNLDKVHSAGWMAHHTSTEAVRMTVRKNLKTGI